jgi:hypothetical protein
VVVNVGFFGMIPLFVLAAVVVAVRQRGMVMGMGVPRGSMLVVVAETASVVVADMPMVVAVLGCRVGVLGLLAFSLGPLPDLCHRDASFRIGGYPDGPA